MSSGTGENSELAKLVYDVTRRPPEISSAVGRQLQQGVKSSRVERYEVQRLVRYGDKKNNKWAVLIRPPVGRFTKIRPPYARSKYTPTFTYIPPGPRPSIFPRKYYAREYYYYYYSTVDDNKITSSFTAANAGLGSELA